MLLRSLVCVSLNITAFSSRTVKTLTNPEREVNACESCCPTWPSASHVFSHPSLSWKTEKPKWFPQLALISAWFLLLIWRMFQCWEIKCWAFPRYASVFISWTIEGMHINELKTPLNIHRGGVFSQYTQKEKEKYNVVVCYFFIFFIQV